MDESYTEQDYTCVKVHPHLSINPLHVQKPKTGDRIAAISRLVQELIVLSNQIIS